MKGLTIVRERLEFKGHRDNFVRERVQRYYGAQPGDWGKPNSFLGERRSKNQEQDHGSGWLAIKKAPELELREVD